MRTVHAYAFNSFTLALFLCNQNEWKKKMNWDIECVVLVVLNSILTLLFSCQKQTILYFGSSITTLCWVFVINVWFTLGVCSKINFHSIRCCDALFFRAGITKQVKSSKIGWWKWLRFVYKTKIRRKLNSSSARMYMRLSCR